MFNVQELATAVQQQHPVITVVFNDNAYGNVRRIQQQNYGGRVIATDLVNPDFVKLAEAVRHPVASAPAVPDALRGALEQRIATNEPTPDRGAGRRDAVPVAICRGCGEEGVSLSPPSASCDSGPDPMIAR